MSKATPKIFISYRRADSAGHTGRLVDKLQSAFGKDSTFVDILTIAPGADFRKTIEEAINDCNVLLTIIGKNWLLSAQKEMPEGAVDWLRVEIATALKRDILVIPVLVQETKMPAESSLPADLKALTYRNALEIREKYWDHDVNELITFLKRTVAKHEERAPWLNIFLNTSRLRVSVTLFTFLAVIAIGVFLIRNYPATIPSMLSTTATPTPQLSQEDAAIQVWVNTDPKSNTYHCPATRWYGKTKMGEYMSQGEAQRRGYQPASGKVCH